VEWGSALVVRRSSSGVWDHRLSVHAEASGLVGHAGAVLLRRCADATGLTEALGRALPRGGGPLWWDRGVVMVPVAVPVVLGATAMSDIALLDHQASVFARPAVGLHRAPHPGRGRRRDAEPGREGDGRGA
jgi:hypothetical protein